MTSLVFYWSVTGVFSEEYLQAQFSSSTTGIRLGPVRANPVAGTLLAARVPWVEAREGWRCTQASF